jgi:hypothetical protein
MPLTLQTPPTSIVDIIALFAPRTRRWYESRQQNFTRLFGDIGSLIASFYTKRRIVLEIRAASAGVVRSSPASKRSWFRQNPKVATPARMIIFFGESWDLTRDQNTNSSRKPPIVDATASSFGCGIKLESDASFSIFSVAYTSQLDVGCAPWSEVGIVSQETECLCGASWLCRSAATGA